jgi:hypothetical protein
LPRRDAATPWALLNSKEHAMMKLTSLLGAFALVAAVVPPSAAAESLDGRSFQGVFLERGKTSGDADTLTFKDGRFRSSACDKYGYSEAPYKATTVGDTMRFETETQSAKYGKLLWNGTVRDGKLDAKVMMVRGDGKAPTENWVVAAEKK